MTLRRHAGAGRAARDGPDAAKLRANRLALLSEIRAATLNVADFSKIAG